MEIKTFIGRKLDYVTGIFRRQIELDRPIKNRNDVKLTYEYYTAPKNPFDFIAKRYFKYPFYNCYRKRKSENTVFHLVAQYFGDLTQFLNKNKTIITVLDIFQFLERGNIRNPRITQLYSLSGLKKCRCIISISKFTTKEIIKLFNIPKERIVTIVSGINGDMFRPIPEKEMENVEQYFPNELKILHVGIPIIRKNFETLLKAIYICKKDGLNIKLIKLGANVYSDLIKRLDLEQNIIFVSRVDNQRLAELYNMCDFFVFPSTYEGFGFPGLEAASCGTPVI